MWTLSWLLVVVGLSWSPLCTGTRSCHPASLCQERSTHEKLGITTNEKINQPKTSLSDNFQGEESIKWILNRQELSTWAGFGPNVLPGASQQEPSAKPWSPDQHLSHDKKLFKSKAAHKGKRKKKKKSQRHKSALASSPVWASSVFLLMLLLGWDRGNGWHGDGCGRQTTRLPGKEQPEVGMTWLLSWATSSSPALFAAAAQLSQLEVWNVLRDEVFCAHGCSEGTGLALEMF